MIRYLRITVRKGAALACAGLLMIAGCSSGGGVVPAWGESRLEREVSAQVAKDPFPSAAEAGLKSR